MAASPAMSTETANPGAEVADFETTQAVISQALRGNEHAIAMINLLRFVVQIWDDLIDRDREVPDAHVHRAFYAALIDLPRNPFYRTYSAELLPVLTNVILNWHASNALRRDEKPALRHAANVMRNRLADMVMICAAIIGGPAHAEAWASRVAAVVYDEPLRY